ncbi:MAG: hypothetical protein JXR96_09360 [Deltaproteobacteria bacterium]|nr:hypothetical protein [Deltaproteobacteria bacterium]
MRPAEHLPHIALAWLLACLACACGDDVQGELHLLVVPLHAGRNPSQDPFQLVDEVEIGLTADDGTYTALGADAPGSRFGPGLVSPGAQGAPTLIGRNERERVVSLGFGPGLALTSGLDAWVSVPFARVDHAVATRVHPAEIGLEDLFAGRPPALRLDGANLETGSLDGQGDAAALVWLLWTDDALWVQARVRDEDVQDGVDGLAVFDAQHASGVRIAAGGAVDPAGAVEAVESERLAGGYRLRFRMPLEAAAKNGKLAFDLRLVDVDAGSGPTWLTWAFDPRRQGDLPLPDEYGQLVLGAPLLDLMTRESGTCGDGGPRADIPGPDGVAVLQGGWDEAGLGLCLEIPDDDVQLEGGEVDRVELYFDLANGGAPVAEPFRFHRLEVTAGGLSRFGSGADPAALSDGAYTGSAQATRHAAGYRIEADLPWSDLQVLGDVGQRGWFLGLEIRVFDVDQGGRAEWSWSGREELAPASWSEIRLFSDPAR